MSEALGRNNRTSMSDESHVHSLGDFFSLFFGSTEIETFAETIDLKVSIEQFSDLMTKRLSTKTIDVEVQRTIGENDDTCPVGEKSVGCRPMNNTCCQRRETEETRMNDQDQIHPGCSWTIVHHQSIASSVFTLKGRTITRTRTQRRSIRSDRQLGLNDMNDNASIEENDQNRRNDFRDDRSQSRVIPSESHIREKCSPKGRRRLFQGTNRSIGWMKSEVFILLHRGSLIDIVHRGICRSNRTQKIISVVVMKFISVCEYLWSVLGSLNC